MFALLKEIDGALRLQIKVAAKAELGAESSGEKKQVELCTLEEICQALSSGLICSSTAITAAAAQGMALAREEKIDLVQAKLRLDSTRPSSQNLADATARMLAKGRQSAQPLFDEVKRIAEESAQGFEKMSELGAALLVKSTLKPTREIGILHLGSNINSNALACVFKRQADAGVVVYQDEEQVAAELESRGVPHKRIVRGGAASLLLRGRGQTQCLVDALIFDADRVCANGDVVSEIGTLALAVCAREFGIPVYCIAPAAAVDFATETGDVIELDEQAGFEVTPSKYITAIVTSQRVCYAPFAHSLATLDVAAVAAELEKLAVTATAPAVVESAAKASLLKTTKRGAAATGLFLGDGEDERETKPSAGTSRAKYAQAATNIGGEDASATTQGSSSSNISSVRQFADVRKSSIFLSDAAESPLVVKSSVRITAKAHTPAFPAVVPPEQEREPAIGATSPAVAATILPPHASKGHFPGHDNAQEEGRKSAASTHTSMSKGFQPASSQTNTSHIFG